MDPLKDALTRPDGIAVRLHALRVQADIQAKDLAETLGWHPSKVSRIENGKTGPTVEDIRKWVRACGGDDEAADGLEEMLSAAQTEHRNWRMSMRHGQAGVQVGYNKLVGRAHTIRHFEMAAIPGLLQTPEYARRMLSETVRLHSPEVRDEDEAVAIRMERQKYLYDPTKSFDFLLAEPVLRWRVCPPGVMRGQLDRLQTVIGLERVRFGILPLDKPIATIPQNSVGLYVGEEQIVAAVETFAGETIHRGDEAVTFNLAVDYLWSDAVTGEDARELIIAATQALPPE